MHYNANHHQPPFLWSIPKSVANAVLKYVHWDTLLHRIKKENEMNRMEESFWRFDNFSIFALAFDTGGQ